MSKASKPQKRKPRKKEPLREIAEVILHLRSKPRRTLTEEEKKEIDELVKKLEGKE